MFSTAVLAQGVANRAIIHVSSNTAAVAHSVQFVYYGHMKTVSATDAKQRLAALLDAAQREPVMIRRQNRDVAVILSVEEYQRIRRSNIKELERLMDRIGAQ